MPPRALPIPDRFWSKVERRQPNECWPWLGSRVLKSPRGPEYGQFKLPHGRTTSAHRLSWQINYGAIPSGLFVCHRCDNPLCVNPTHLFLGTHKDNMADMKAKGSQAVGERVGTSRLAAETVQSIRRALAAGMTTREAAKAHGVSQTTSRLIGAGIRWSHLPDEPEAA